MTDLSTVIENAKTWAEGLSWQSDDGGGNTSFQQVYTYENWQNRDGYPFLVILDQTSLEEAELNTHVVFRTGVEFSVCVNWAVINKTDEDLQRQEAALRLREAWSNFRQELIKVSVTDAIYGNQQQGWGANYEFSNADIPELNLMRKTATISLKEPIARI